MKKYVVMGFGLGIGWSAAKLAITSADIFTDKIAERIVRKVKDNPNASLRLKKMIDKSQSQNSNRFSLSRRLSPTWTLSFCSKLIFLHF